MDHEWEYAVLGPVEVRRRGKPVRIKSRKQRAVLALLLLRANRVVGVDTIIDGLWGEEPPATAGAALQVHVANLRKSLGVDATDHSPIATEPPGYVITVAPDSLDLTRYEQLVSRGRAELERDRPSEASTLLARALDCWRGPALGDLANEPFAQSVLVGLEEERLGVLADRIDADLARGAHAQIVGELRSLTAQHPLRERFWAQLVLALYRGGSQADALAAYRFAREALLDELGLEPGAALRALETAVLDQSPSLDLGQREVARGGSLASTVFGDEPSARSAYLEIGDDRVAIIGRTTIGRSPAHALVLDGAKVSRDHAVVRATPDGCVLTDLHSTNGTFVNGKRVDESMLGDGDRITIGEHELVFRIDEH